MEGKNVGLQALSSAMDALQDHPIYEKIGTVTEFSDNVLALNDLKSGRVDAVVIDEVVINYYMSIEENTFKVLDESLGAGIVRSRCEKRQYGIVEQIAGSA